MTKKDYILIADAIWQGYKPYYEAHNPDAKAVVMDVVDAMAAALNETNPRFNRVRFVNRCFGIK